jgi:glycerophosphoryl diester phosphodiesterase
VIGMQLSKTTCLYLAGIAAVCSIAATIDLASTTASNERVNQLLRLLHAADSSYVMVVAHRGDWRNHPENSLPAFESAIEMGVDMLEIDIRRSSDGHLVVIHDKTLERTTTGKGRVDAYTLAALKKLYLKNGYGMPTDHRIPTLREVLQLSKGRVLVYIDKSEDLIIDVYQDAVATGTEQQVCFYGRRTAAELKTELGPLFDQLTYFPKVGDRTKACAEYIADFERTLDPAAFIVDFQSATSPIVTLMPRMRAQGSRVWASPLWDTLAGGKTDDRAISDPDGNWGWLIDHGASMICTDRPRLLIEYLQSKGYREVQFAVQNNASPGGAQHLLAPKSPEETSARGSR